MAILGSLLGSLLAASITRRQEPQEASVSLKERRSQEP